MSGDQFDVVIIGAGVIGCSIARELARFDALRILVVEQENDVSTGASKANSGIVHGGYDERHGTVKASVSHLGNQLFAQLQRRLNFGFRRTGSMVCAFSDQDLKTIEDLLENGRKNGVKGLRIIGHEEALSKEPQLSPRVKGALYCPHTGITSPYEYCIALAENAATNGVQFQFNTQVVAFSQSDSDDFIKIHVKHYFGNDHKDSTAEQLSYSARIVINCAGLGSDHLARLWEGPSNSPFTIEPRKGEYLILAKQTSRLHRLNSPADASTTVSTPDNIDHSHDFIRHVLFPAPDPVAGKGILVSPTYWNNILLGPTSRPASQKFTNEQVIEELVGGGLKLVPALDVRRAITSYAGWRAKCSHRDFYIQWSAKKNQSGGGSGMLYVAGIDSPGLTSSPAVALMVVKMVCEYAERESKLRPFLTMRLKAPHTFMEHRPAIIHMKTEEFLDNCTYSHDDPKFHLICRCEKITKAEVLDAVDRLPKLPQHTLATVKRRTRCGMGPCQGTFCAPRLQELLGEYFHVSEREIRGFEQGTSILPSRRVGEKERDYLERIQRRTNNNNKL